MSVSRIQNLFRVRDLLDSPMPNHPSFHRMMEQEISVEMDVVNQTNLSGQPWAVSTYELNYTVGQDEYTLNVTDWGKVIYVERLQGDSYIRYVSVPFSDINNLNYGTVWEYNFGTLPWATVTPERMAFFRDGALNPQVKVRIQPEPQQSWTYVIHYMPGYIGTTDPLSVTTQMPEHAEMVRLRVAAALLPYTKWSEDEAVNDKKRDTLAKAFAFQLETKERLFSKYIQNITSPKTVEVSDWQGDFW